MSCISENPSQIKNNSIDTINYLKDENFSLNEIMKKKMIPLKNNKISYKNGTYWFKVILNKKSKTYKQLIFQIQEPSVSFLSVYNSKGIIDSKKSTKGNPTLFISVDNELNDVYFLKSTFERQVHFPLIIQNESQFYKSQEKNNLNFGLYYGMTLMVFIFNLIFYFSLKDKVFLYYSFFLAMINLSFTGFDGISNYFIKQDFFNVTIVFFHFLIQVFGTLFVSKFLGLKQFYPKLNLWGYLSLIISALFYVLFLIIDKFIYFAIADLFGLLILAYFWILGIIMIKKEEYAKFFVLGYCMVLIFGVFYLIPLNFGIPYFSITLNHLKLGALFEMLVLTYAITYRIKKLQEENDTYRHELKSYLEEIYGLKEELKFKNNNDSKDLVLSKINKLKNKFILTDREMDILIKISEGLSNNQIAEKLFISINTVKYHTKNLYDKLDIKKRAELSSKILIQ